MKVRSWCQYFNRSHSDVLTKLIEIHIPVKHKYLFTIMLTATCFGPKELSSGYP